ncbi:MAG: HAMP domain-containing histidine kinase [Hamadaea sp.]|uniref:sensor histidine kinase n=1 Tax=Hamadaea sp. TaxID=2024425 RepID=UPI0018374963|nr:HAMP domain-containing sensor histidine kinase [Hamadaea sp.]NUR69924.1 HAMP domain-containing histidine kinase [Hamadaea sp.]NUT22528.1 HAMP domain-containing histidine kinase [Hamadaea sp.]
MTVLLAAAFLAVGVTTIVALDKTLDAQIDRQLTAAATRAPKGYDSHKPKPAGTSCSAGSDQDGWVLGQSIGTLNARLCDGEVTSASVLTEQGQTSPDLADAYANLRAVPLDGKAHTIELCDQGAYRVVARQMDDGAILITGLPLEETRETVLLLTIVVGAATVLVLGSVAVGGTVIVRRALRPLSRVAATATRVSQVRLDRGEVELPQRVDERDTDPRTEVGQVGAALNRMLDHVGEALEARHASETQVRQFVADASHELRTPLASIRGYAELSRRHDLPDDVGHLLDRMESEARRMSGLVEDLLLLARLDAGRPLEYQPVDLTSLVVDAVGDAHAAGPGHVWRLDVPEEPVVVTGDRARLHQVVANLLGNARTHTPERTVVTVAVAPATADAVLTVTDAGPGIPAELLPHVFERFARGDGSRSRTAGSTGLGLAIVQAVVAAHHGEVSVSSEPGRTTFTVRLPLAD